MKFFLKALAARLPAIKGPSIKIPAIRVPSVRFTALDRPAPGSESLRPAKLSVRLHGVFVASGVVIFGFIGGFAVWAMTAPLSSGAVVRGTVGPEGSRKVVQHFEGGIVGGIFVKEGDFVTRGQLLLSLQPAQAQAANAQVRTALSRHLAEAARLSAQLAGQEIVDFTDAERVGADDTDFAAFLNEQRALFETTQRDQIERRELLEAQIQKLGAQVDGDRSRISGSEAQRKLIDIQIDDTQGLMNKGLARKPQLLDLQRRRSELDTEIAGLNADIRRAEIETIEKNIALRSAVTTYRNETSTALAKTRSEIASLQSQFAGSQDVLARTRVTASDTGYVLNLQAKTVGGVVRAGTEILEIVPTEGDLVIEGRVSPQEIRSIAPDQRARVSFLTFAQRDMPMIEGRVLSVSADVITDPQTRQDYYTARIAVDRAAFAAYAKPTDMKPGTPVEAYVEARTRVAMDYFLEPVVHSFRRSFREN